MKKKPQKINRRDFNPSADHLCPVEMTVEVIGGRWKCAILHHLLEGKKRFNELRRLIPKASQRMLTRHLRELESHGIIERKVYQEVPPKTEYFLTKIGHSLEPVLWAMHDWAEDQLINRDP